MKIARQEMYLKLKTRKDELQQELFARISKLRELCLKEAVSAIESSFFIKFRFKDFPVYFSNCCIKTRKMNLWAGLL